MLTPITFFNGKLCFLKQELLVRRVVLLYMLANLFTVWLLRSSWILTSVSAFALL